MDGTDWTEWTEWTLMDGIRAGGSHYFNHYFEGWLGALA